MHTFLLAAALAVGSGDGRDGVTDSRTVEKVPPYTLLRVGMSQDDVKELLGDRFLASNGSVIVGWSDWYFPFQRDILGNRRSVDVRFHLGQVTSWSISLPK
jgi:hypothetical protein